MFVDEQSSKANSSFYSLWGCSTEKRRFCWKESPAGREKANLQQSPEVRSQNQDEEGTPFLQIFNVLFDRICLFWLPFKYVRFRFCAILWPSGCYFFRGDCFSNAILIIFIFAQFLRGFLYIEYPTDLYSPRMFANLIRTFTCTERLKLYAFNYLIFFS